MTDRTSPKYEHNGRSLTVAEWATITGIRSYDISMRLRQGWTLARIIAEVKPISAPAELLERQPVLHMDSEIEVDTDMRDYVPRVFTTRPTSQPASDKPQASNVFRLAYNGETLTLKEWSAKIGVSPGTIGARLHKGWTIEAALSPKPTPVERLAAIKAEPKLYTFDGRSLTIREWSEEAGLNAGVIHNRLSRGWTLARALTEDVGVVQQKRLNLITYNGVTLCEAAWARRLGMSRATIKHRLKRGQPLSEVLNPSFQQRHALRTHDGKTLTYKQWAAETGLKYHTIMQRVHKGWTLARALTTPVASDRMGAARAALAACRALDATQPEGAMSGCEGGGSATFDPHRGPAGDGSRESAPKQGFF